MTKEFNCASRQKNLIFCRTTLGPEASGAESFGLDTRIGNLTGKRAVGFYGWDLECLADVSDIARKDAPVEQHPMIDGLLTKIRAAEQLT